MTTATIATGRGYVTGLTSRLNLNLVKSALFYYVLATYALKAKRHLAARGIVTSVNEVYMWIAKSVIHLAMKLPANRKKVEDQMGRAKLDIENKLVPKGPDVVRHLTLPQEGKSLQWILVEMDKMDKEFQHTGDWRSGKVSGAVYHGGDDLEKIIVAAYERYCCSNPLHPGVFPATRKMEAEIVAMTLRMYNHPNGAGAMTSGGTESIIMAIKTYRDWARAVKGIKEPEMIIPSSAHAAFDKGASYLGVKVHTISVDSYTRRVDIKRVKRAINPNTIMLVGSAINFPDGNQDDISALGQLARRYNIGLHVDCCLGSFIVPFLEPAGLAEGQDGRYKLLPFDFRVEGVTSISCDTHKYGFAPKGTSVIMYRDAELRKYQYYLHPSWSGGVYASPAISGSRPGALLAGTWAVMQYMGSNGYLESCRSIVTAARRIADGIRTSIPELYVVGDPPASVVAFASQHPRVDVMEVGDAMSKRGWHLNALLDPKAVHIACTRLTLQAVDQFLADLKDAVEEAKIVPSGRGAMVSLYGLGRSNAAGPDLVGGLATAFLDSLYKA